MFLRKSPEEGRSRGAGTVLTVLLTAVRQKSKNFFPKICGYYLSAVFIYLYTENIFFKNRGYYSSAVFI